jgi:hypothetical protein
MEDQLRILANSLQINTPIRNWRSYDRFKTTGPSARRILDPPCSNGRRQTNHGSIHRESAILGVDCVPLAHNSKNKSQECALDSVSLRIRMWSVVRTCSCKAELMKQETKVLDLGVAYTRSGRLLVKGSQIRSVGSMLSIKVVASREANCSSLVRSSSCCVTIRVCCATSLPTGNIRRRAGSGLDREAHSGADSSISGALQRSERIAEEAYNSNGVSWDPLSSIECRTLTSSRRMESMWHQHLT